MRDVRLDIRVRSEEKERISRAAAADGLTLSQFVRIAVAGHADAVLAELHEITLLDATVHEKVLDRLAEPVALTTQMRVAEASRRGLPADEAERLRTEPCKATHLRHTFLSDDPELDEWFRAGEWLRASEPIRAAEATHCYVWCSRGYDEVDGYYTLTSHRLARHGPTERGERSVIGLRLTRLASGRWHPDVDLEALLLVDAIGRATAAARAGAAEFLAIRPGSDAHRLALCAQGFWGVPRSDVLIRGLVDGGLVDGDDMPVAPPFARPAADLSGQFVRTDPGADQGK